VSKAISGLQPGDTYHFRLTANNSQGPGVVGSDAQFQTLKANQSIIFGPAPSVIVGGTGTVSTTGGGSGNPVIFSSTTTSVCTTGGTNGSTVTGVAAGSCIIAANQAGNDHYNPAPQVTLPFSIGKITQAITFGPLPVLFVGETATVSATGGASGNPVTFASTTTAVCTTGGTNGSSVTGVATGSCIIAANQTGNARYNAAPQVTKSFNVTVGLALTVRNLNHIGGAVTSDMGGIACGATCSANFASGALVKLTAIPVDGYQFSGWGGACSGYGNSCTLTMAAATTATANFEVFKRHRPIWKRALFMK
jgi:hypothetical protein